MAARPLKDHHPFHHLETCLQHQKTYMLGKIKLMRQNFNIYQAQSQSKHFALKFKIELQKFKGKN